MYFRLFFKMSSQTVDIGSKSGKFKYILVQQGQKTLLRGDPNSEYHGRECLLVLFK
jgi:hypothetical protein